VSVTQRLHVLAGVAQRFSAAYRSLETLPH
jgi:hypothetical protein